MKKRKKICLSPPFPLCYAHLLIPFARLDSWGGKIVFLSMAFVLIQFEETLDVMKIIMVWLGKRASLGFDLILFIAQTETRDASALRRMEKEIINANKSFASFELDRRFAVALKWKNFPLNHSGEKLNQFP
jgi:hypothetical protein